MYYSRVIVTIRIYYIHNQSLRHLYEPICKVFPQAERF